MIFYYIFLHFVASVLQFLHFFVQAYMLIDPIEKWDSFQSFALAR